jgi:hypothetical protein
MASACLIAVFTHILPSVYQPSPVIGDERSDNAVRDLSNIGHYHTTFVRPQHVDASRSTFYDVQGNVVNNVNVSNTVVVDSTSLAQACCRPPRPFNHHQVLTKILLLFRGQA